MFKHLLAVIAASVVGFLGFYAYTGQLSQLTQTITRMAQPLVNTFQPIITQIQHTWTNIPDSIRGIILLGIPSSFAMFFAWTKTRAMQKLQQTQLEANQQITQITGEALETKQVLETKVQTLENQVTNMPQQYTQQYTQKISDLTSKVTQLEQEKEKLQSEYNLAVRTLAEKNKLPEPRKSVP